MIRLQMQQLRTKRLQLQGTELLGTTFPHLRLLRRKSCCRRRTIHSHCDSRTCIERRSLLALGDGTSSRSAPGKCLREELFVRIWYDGCRWYSCDLSRTRTFRYHRQNPVQGHSRTECFVCSFQGRMWWACISKRERMIRRQAKVIGWVSTYISVSRRNKVLVTRTLVVEARDVCSELMTLFIRLAVLPNLYEASACVVVFGEILQATTNALVADRVVIVLDALFVHLARLIQMRGLGNAASRVVGFNKFVVASALAGLEVTIWVWDEAWAVSEFIAECDFLKVTREPSIIYWSSWNADHTFGVHLTTSLVLMFLHLQRKFSHELVTILSR